jgi:hypothetical protein
MKGNSVNCGNLKVTEAMVEQIMLDPMMNNWNLIDWVGWSKMKILLLKEKGILVILHDWAEFQVKGQNHTLEFRLQSLGLNWSK